MITNIFDFGYTRTLRQAFLWYIVWLLMIAVGAGIVAGIIVGTGASLGWIEIDSDQAFVAGYQIGLIIGVGATIVICWKLLAAKNLGESLKWIGLSLLAVVLTYFTGGLGGLIIPAMMTMVPVETKTTK